ncbi:unnamed protein product, partial [Schistosoma turkestanicum]
NLTNQYISINNLKAGKTIQTIHTKEPQPSCSSPTTSCQQIINDTKTMTNVSQFSSSSSSGSSNSRSGFLRYPLRKAMSYVKPQSESFVTTKSTSRRLHHTSTFERPDDPKFRSTSKSSSRNSLYLSSNIKHSSDLSTK